MEVLSLAIGEAVKKNSDKKYEHHTRDQNICLTKHIIKHRTLKLQRVATFFPLFTVQIYICTKCDF